MSYKDLTVWQKSMELTLSVYNYTSKFPEDERFGLISQMRRAAVSIPSNIAEGSHRDGKEDHHFLTFSYGSGAELETQLELSSRLHYGEEAEHEKCTKLLDEVMRMLNTMVHKNHKQTSSHYHLTTNH